MQIDKYGNDVGYEKQWKRKKWKRVKKTEMPEDDENFWYNDDDDEFNFDDDDDYEDYFPWNYSDDD